jgi:hypothetical protein
MNWKIVAICALCLLAFIAIGSRLSYTLSNNPLIVTPAQ